MAVRVRINKKYHNEDIEKMLRRFKKKCEKEGLVKDIKKQEYFESKGVKRRRAKRKMAKQIEKERIEKENSLERK